MRILKKYRKDGIVKIGSDKKKLDTPIHEITSISIDTINRKIGVTITHKVMQGSVINLYERTEEVLFVNLPTSIQATGKAFLDAIEIERMKLSQYSGSVEL